ncbi:MAG TPA: hypothetical protein DDZ80_05295 [Cyanobacteria bacterium UBA8803]|nr:hypothetical protein [Cyanobacteria bacterium UBA9273]HBL57959.1 hypothetical protein [Cyanobacteria bacterium UBA8803]
MYESDLIEIEAKSNPIEGVWQEAQKLSIDEKAELVEKLLGQESGLIVVSASSHLADYVIAQTHLLSLEGLTYVWKAIATQIVGEGEVN